MAVLVAVAALVVATVASFAVTRGGTPSLRPTGCGVAKARCIAGYRYEVDASKEGAASFDMQGMIG